MNYEGPAIQQEQNAKSHTAPQKNQTATCQRLRSKR
jgi:hypothetical protein